jgi:hypothetical protein
MAMGVGATIALTWLVPSCVNVIPDTFSQRQQAPALVRLISLNTALFEPFLAQFGQLVL